METSSSGGFAQWAYGIGRLHYARHGRTDIRRGSSVRSDGIVLTMSLCLANDISGICSIRTKNITTKLGRTYRCTRTRRSRVPSRPSVARWRCQFWVDCTINISGRKFPTGTTDCFAPSFLHRGGCRRSRSLKPVMDSSPSGKSFVPAFEISRPALKWPPMSIILSFIDSNHLPQAAIISGVGFSNP